MKKTFSVNAEQLMDMVRPFIDEASTLHLLVHDSGEGSKPVCDYCREEAPCKYQVLFDKVKAHIIEEPDDK